MPDTGSATPSHGRSVVLSHIRDCQFTVNHQTLHAHAAAERLQQRRANPIRLLREFEAQWQDATMIAFLSLPWPPQSDQALGPIIEALWCRGEGQQIIHVSERS